MIFTNVPLSGLEYNINGGRLQARCDFRKISLDMPRTPRYNRNVASKPMPYLLRFLKGVSGMTDGELLAKYAYNLAIRDAITILKKSKDIQEAEERIEALIKAV